MEPTREDRVLVSARALKMLVEGAAHAIGVGIDATTLEANAALRSIVRRDTGEEYDAWLTRLAAASGIATQTRAELARFDRKRKKKGANDDWTNPHDPEAKITKLKDGRTHLAHTAEHAVDLETGAVVGVTVQDADDGDTTTMVETLITAAEPVEAVLPAGAGITEVVGDKGYHSNDTMVAFADLGIRSYVSEPDRGRRNWKGKAAAREAVYANRRRIRGTRGQRLLRQRGVVQVARGYSSLGARRQAHASDAGDVGHAARLVALLFLSTCRNYKVSNERIHRIAIEAKRLEDVVSQMNCVKHRRYCDIVRRLR